MRSNPAIHFPQLLEKEKGTTTNGHEKTRIKEKSSDYRLMKTNAPRLASIVELASNVGLIEGQMEAPAAGPLLRTTFFPWRRRVPWRQKRSSTSFPIAANASLILSLGAADSTV
jgi:hypothetical protein